MSNAAMYLIAVCVPLWVGSVCAAYSIGKRRGHTLMFNYIVTSRHRGKTAE